MQNSVNSIGALLDRKDREKANRCDGALRIRVTHTQYPRLKHHTSVKRIVPQPHAQYRSHTPRTAATPPERNNNHPPAHTPPTT